MFLNYHTVIKNPMVMTYTLGFDLHRHLLQIKIFVHHKPLI